MIIKRMHPSVRLSIGLIALTISILLAGELLGVVPDKSQVTIDTRKKLSEILAVQFAHAAEREDFAQIQATLNLLVKRNPEVLSVAVRNDDGSFYAKSGSHETVWQNPAGSSSSSSNIQIPITQGDALWGTVEIGYTPLMGKGFLGGVKNSFWGMLLFVAIFGFLGYLVFLKRALKDLDPSKVN